jgi:hypothetical protein
MIVTTCPVCLFQWRETPDPMPCYRCKCDRLRADYEQATEGWRAEINAGVKEIALLRKELARRLDPKQIELLMRSLERATGCTREEITCGPMDCAIQRARELDRLRKENASLLERLQRAIKQDYCTICGGLLNEYEE